MIITFACKTEKEANQHIQDLLGALHSSNLFPHVPMRSIPASGNSNFALSSLMSTATPSRAIVFVGPDQLNPRNRKKLAGKHFLSSEVVVIVSCLPDIDSARRTAYWTAPRNPDNRVIVIDASRPEWDAEIIQKLYRLTPHIRAKFRRITEQKIVKFEQELPQLRSQAFDGLVGEPNRA